MLLFLFFLLTVSIISLNTAIYTHNIPLNYTTILKNQHIIHPTYLKSIQSILLQRILYLHYHSSDSVLLHVHIPKVGGTALSIALSSECQCQNKLKETLTMKNICKQCPRIHDQLYSYSRLNGWIFGLHAPYGVIADKIIKKKYHEKHITPVSIILLREPFDRFISECIHLVKRNECFRDWSAVLHCTHPKRLSYRAKKSITSFVYDYALYNMSLLLHNRQTKMIGGLNSDFNMKFVFRFEVGSRWLRNDSAASIVDTRIRAENLLLYSPNVVCKSISIFICIYNMVRFDV